METYYQPTTSFIGQFSGAAAAYSVRCLTAGSSTARCMKVRRDSDNATQDIGFDSNGDLDTAAISSHCGANNGYVVTWYDQSGSGQNVTNSTTTQQPKIYNGTAVITENGKPALDFQDDVIYTSGNITLSDGAFLSVAVGTTNNGQNNVLLASDGSPRVGQFVRTSNNTIQSIGFTSGGSAVVASGPSVAVDTQFIGIGQCTGTLLTAYANGTGGTALSLTNRTDSAPLYLGARSAALQDAHNGYIQEVIHYPDDQSSNRSGIDSNINTYFSVY